MRTVLVTGGAGFIGSHLVDELLEGGASVRVLDNLSNGSLGNLSEAAERHSRGGTRLKGGRLEVIIGDIRDRELLRKALRSVKYVFHLAALPASAVPLTSAGEVHAVNVEGTLNVLHGALTEGVWRVVLGSCASVYGTADTLPVSEDAALRPSSLFGASKAAAETYSRTFHVRHRLDTVSLRYFTVYGARQRPAPQGGIIASLIEALLQRRPLTDVDERSAEDFLYIDDAVAATLAAARAPRAAGRVINVGSGQMVTIGDTVRILGGLMRAAVVEGSPSTRGDRPNRLCAQMSLAEELLDFRPRVSLIAGLARLVRSRVGGGLAERAAVASVGLEE